MYLAIILAVWTLGPHAAAVETSLLAAVAQESQPAQEKTPPATPQEPATNAAPAAPAQGTEAESGNEKKTAPEVPPQPAPSAASPKGESETPKAGTAKPGKKTASGKKKRHRKPSATARADAAPGNTPEKTVVHNGGTGDPEVQLAPGMSKEQASQQRQSTSDMLASTEANLKQAAERQLVADQQQSVDQIHLYMEQAQEAEKAGDVQRAKNLASKALMLSEELVKK